MSREWLCLFDEYFPERVFHCVRVRVHKDALEALVFALGHYHRKLFQLSQGEFEVDFFVSLKELGGFLEVLEQEKLRREGYVGPPSVSGELFTLREALACKSPKGAESLPQLCE